MIINDWAANNICIEDYKTQLPDLYIEQIIDYTASSVEIQKYTSDMERFADRNKFDTWLKKGRQIYVLVKNSQTDKKVVGIIWFGKKTMPQLGQLLPEFSSINLQKFQFTFAIRMYGEGQGKGWASPFMQAALDKFVQTSDYKNSPSAGFWLTTAQDNIAAIKVYEKIGFVRITEPTSQGRICMIKIYEQKKT